MTQLAKVESIIGHDMVRVSVQRKSACSHDCADCAGCEALVSHPDVTAVAKNKLGARRGDIVLIESGTGAILRAAAVVYLLPFFLFFVGYFIGHAVSFSENMSILCAFIGFGMGGLTAVALDRQVKRKNSLQFKVIEITKPCSDM